MSRMPRFLCAFLFFLTCASGEDDFFSECPPSRCSAGGPEIRFPFRLKSSPPSCGLEGMELHCSANNDTTIVFPWSAGYRVTSIDYLYMSITVDGPIRWDCPLNLSSNSGVTSPNYAQFGDLNQITMINCSTTNTSTAVDAAGPLPCTSGGGYFAYAVGGSERMADLPSHCEIVKSLDFPFFPQESGGGIWMGTPVDLFRNGTGKVLIYLFTGCLYDCESSRKGCGFNKARNQFNCSAFNPSHGGSHVMLITGASVGGFLIVVLAGFAYFYMFRKPDNEKETQIKVKKFLASYNTAKLTRYSYTDIRKIAIRFRHKLGQGGFGHVYKGELPNGIPVAVKMLEKSVGDGKDFINEVSTIGRIHHVNVVRLLGFCSEGSRRALVYEFMPNESLEKFIFSKESRNSSRSLSLEKLQEIAIGVARGVEYLHQGCNQRILHFDIKPHNILLDHDFNPKISDFGLAKLCSRDESIVSMTAARGTMGYIAPEIYSRNFGTVSYKSDVYSFGMLLMDMVEGWKNMDPTTENQSQIYFPEWIYGQLISNEELALGMEIKGKEEIAKKLAIVALWCIQWAPADRPSMTEVVHMLTGNLETLQIPPKPFISSSD